jgi:hypothetical protein
VEECPGGGDSKAEQELHAPMSDDERQPIDNLSPQPGPVISVIVYTLNDSDTIERCLDSLVHQRCQVEFEVIVVDDCSSDGTPQAIASRFPQFRLLTQGRKRGWVASIRLALDTVRGQTLAFLGAHCSADERWVATIADEISSGRQVITGMGTHGEQRFLHRFEALSVHSDYVGREEGQVGFVWDDNFAIRSAVLEHALPDLDGYLSDGAGAVLLSLELRRQGIPIYYRPSVQIDHATHSLGTVIRFWHGEMARNAVSIKLADGSLPLARLLWLGPIAAGILTAGRLWHGVQAVLRSRRSLQVSLPEAALHCCLLACLMPSYFTGLCREIARNWDQIRAGPRLADAHHRRSGAG